MVQELKIEGVTVKKLSDRIVENIIHADTELDEAKIMEIKHANQELMYPNSYGVLVTSHPSSSVTKEGRELAASKSFQQNTIAKALIVKSMPLRLMGKIYIRLNRPYITTKIFEERTLALEWLEDQVNG